MTLLIYIAIGLTVGASVVILSTLIISARTSRRELPRDWQPGNPTEDKASREWIQRKRAQREARAKAAQSDGNGGTVL